MPRHELVEGRMHELVRTIMFGATRRAVERPWSRLLEALVVVQHTLEFPSCFGAGLAFVLRAVAVDEDVSTRIGVVAYALEAIGKGGDVLRG